MDFLGIHLHLVFQVIVLLYKVLQVSVVTQDSLVLEHRVFLVIRLLQDLVDIHRMLLVLLVSQDIQDLVA